ncbi:dihydrofolate reductase family protein [Pseudolysinimonas sp.]|uniref:dihydrofolate reductase family protein n=1 Tax=Pseudolysinimonas sp. TaxID=2680009 RepID=UPI003F7E07D7
MNLVVSLDGSAVGPDGTSSSLTTGADRAVLGAIRAESDVVLVGAATLRAEPQLVPRTTPLAVLSRSGRIGSAALRPVDVVLGALPERHGRIVCEGGPSVVAQLLDAGLVDEICLTTVPRLVGGTPLPPFGGARTPRLELQHLLVDNAGVSYARYVVRSEDGSAASQSRIAPSQRSGW